MIARIKNWWARRGHKSDVHLNSSRGVAVYDHAVFAGYIVRLKINDVVRVEVPLTSMVEYGLPGLWDKTPDGVKWDFSIVKNKP